jgi:hypothetical protein
MQSHAELMIYTAITSWTHPMLASKVKIIIDPQILSITSVGGSRIQNKIRTQLIQNRRSRCIDDHYYNFSKSVHLSILY